MKMWDRLFNNRKLIDPKQSRGKAAIELGDQNESVEVSIVKGYDKSTHTHTYRIFELKIPILDVGLIGVEDGDSFAIKIKNTSSVMHKVSFAVYLDGVNVSQSRGIHSLNEIPESQRREYHQHLGRFICDFKQGDTTYLYRFNQKNEENRLFSFTTQNKAGINEILINDVALKNRIEV